MLSEREKTKLSLAGNCQGGGEEKSQRKGFFGPCEEKKNEIAALGGRWSGKISAPLFCRSLTALFTLATTSMD